MTRDEIREMAEKVCRIAYGFSDDTEIFFDANGTKIEDALIRVHDEAIEESAKRLESEYEKGTLSEQLATVYLPSTTEKIRALKLSPKEGDANV